MLNGKEMSINQRINANGAFPGIIAFVVEFKQRTGVVLGLGSISEGVKAIRRKHQELNVNPYVMASKKMKQDLRLVGVGKYLKKEN